MKMCKHYPEVVCFHEPCNEAQETECCHVCMFNVNCDSKCKRKVKNEQIEEKILTD